MEPKVGRRPLVSIRSLIDTGTPKRGPAAFSRAARLSASLASAIARSGSTVQKALICGFTLSIRFKTACITSEGLISFAAIILPKAKPDSWQRSTMEALLSLFYSYRIPAQAIEIFVCCLPRVGHKDDVTL